MISEGASRYQVPKNGGNPFDSSQVFRRVTKNLDDDPVAADHDYLQHDSETSVAGWLPQKPMYLNTCLHYVEGVGTASDTLKSADVLGRAASMSGDKWPPSSRPESLPSEVVWKLPKSAQESSEEAKADECGKVAVALPAEKGC